MQAQQRSTAQDKNAYVYLEMLTLSRKIKSER